MLPVVKLDLERTSLQNRIYDAEMSTRLNRNPGWGSAYDKPSEEHVEI